MVDGNTLEEVKTFQHLGSAFKVDVASGNEIMKRLPIATDQLAS